MTYSAMERFNDALEGEPRDRVPLFPMIATWVATNFCDFPFSKMALEPKLVIDAQIRAKERIGYDALYAYADPLYIPEAFGCKVRFPETGPLVDPLPLKITSVEDVDKLPIPNAREDGRLPLNLEVVRGLSKYGGGDIPVLGLFEGAFTSTCRIIEVEHIMRMIYKDRSVLEVLLDKVNGFLLEFGKALIENGANILLIPEPTASASMISPAMFRQFVLPRLQTLTSKLNVPCILHICGDSSPILDAMWETGAKVLSLDQCVNLSEARAIVPKAVLGGNVDPIQSLLMGTRDQVVTNTLNSLQTAGTSRFILMSGCGVAPNTTVDNLEVMISTAIDYGLGPGKELNL